MRPYTGVRFMAESVLRLIKRSAEFRGIDQVREVPRGRRGLYVLYRRRRKAGAVHFDVVYVGMARKGMLARLLSHTKTKQRTWTHFSVFEVWDNVRDDEIVELEGLFRHLYRRDSKANSLNKQRKFGKAFKVREDDFREWRNDDKDRRADVARGS
jgi:hypothetical protein